MDYYKSELEKLNINPEYLPTIVIHSDSVKTKTLALNEESLPVIIEWLQELQNQIKK